MTEAPKTDKAGSGIAKKHPAEIFPTAIKRTPYVVTRRKQETHDVVVLDVAPKAGGEVPQFKPGQFVMVTLLNDDGTPWRRLAYSIASPPGERDHLELAFKVHGAFTTRFSKLQVGDALEIDGPYGLFTINEETMPDVVFFSGGIGVTPFMSMIRHAAAAKTPTMIMLVYCNKTKDDIGYFEDLQLLATQNPNFQVVFSVDEIDDPNWAHEKGIISRAMIEKYCIRFQGKTFFLCGPKPFMDAVKQHLAECGVDEKNIKIEIF
jgi:ferredoxin-NADP reductase